MLECIRQANGNYVWYVRNDDKNSIWIAEAFDVASDYM